MAIAAAESTAQMAKLVDKRARRFGGLDRLAEEFHAEIQRARKTTLSGS